MCLKIFFCEGMKEKISAFVDFLGANGIHVRDTAELTQKLTVIKSEGLEQLQIVSDFDRTLTPQWLKDPCSQTGKLRICQSSHGVVETSSLVSSEYVATTRALAEHYMPLEHDHRLSVEEKKKICEEWYHKAHSCMLQERLTKATVRAIVKECWGDMRIHLREDCSALFARAEELAVPVTVLSAGLADVIDNILDLEKIDIVPPGQDGEAVMVVGNRLEFDSQGAHVGFSEPVVHTLNKRLALADALIRSPLRANRRNAILMGDLIGDVDFVHSIPNLETYIAVAFLADADRHEERVMEYLKHFDIVITGGSASMHVILSLIDALT